METIKRLGTLEQLLDGRPPEIADLVRLLRALVIALDPEVVEVPRPGENNVAYGLGERKMSEAYVYLMPQRAWVNLGFYHAVGLPDPHGLLEGTGANLRHVKVRPGAVDEAALSALIVAARAERKKALSR